MHLQNLFTILFIFSSLLVFANKDSTGVQNNKGKKVIIHKVEAKETYYSLGRKYNVNPKAIMDFNDNISLMVGTVLNIPTDRPFNEEDKSKKDVVNRAVMTRDTSTNYEYKRQKTEVTNSSPIFLQHKVRHNETLSGIAEHFDTSVKTLQELNNLKGTIIHPGQMLKVRQNAPIEQVYEVIEEKEKEKENNTDPKTDANRYGLNEYIENGIATWLDDPSIDGTKLLVLHRTAPIGTVIKITNTMTEKSTFAKVVGKFTENENTKDVIIIITKAVADLIGALDKRFQVTIDYGLNE
jgi:LysM repeat protein